MNKMVLMAGVMLALAGVGMGQTGNLANWDFSDNANPFDSVTADSVATNVSIVKPSCIAAYGKGIESYGGGIWVPNSFTALFYKSTTLPIAIDSNQYLSFTVAPTPGNAITITSVKFIPLAQNSESLTWTLMSSVNGFVSGKEIQSYSNNASCGECPIQTIPVTGHTNLTSQVEFRVYIWNPSLATNGFYSAIGLSNGTTGARTEYDITISGTTAPAQKPGPLTYSSPTSIYTQSTPIPTNTCTNAGGAATSFTSVPPLPSGLLINQTTGAITGTPSVSSPQTTYSITATNTVGTSTPVVLTITVNPVKPGTPVYKRNPLLCYSGILITPDSLTTNIGTATFSVTPTLPAGLILNPTTGIISGSSTVITPLTPYKIKATNATGTDSVTLQISVTAAPGPIKYSLDSATYYVGLVTAPITVTNSGGAPDSFTIAPAFALGSGLAINKTTGVISGTPATALPRTVFTITAKNPAGTTTATVILTVIAPPSITYKRPTLVLTVGLDMTPDTCVNAGGPADRFTIDSIPAGLSIDSLTGRISGRPTVPHATATYKVTATNKAGVSSANITITVQQLPPGPLTYKENSATYIAGRIIDTNTITNSGGTADTFTVSPALPNGLRLNGKTGAISGTPADTTTGSLQFTITARNSSGTSPVTITIKVIPAGRISNPYVVKAVKTGPTQVKLSISGYEGIKSVSDLLNPWSDTLSVWYKTGSFPLSPVKSDPNQIRFSLAALQTRTAPYDTTIAVPAVPAAGLTYYYFVPSSYWHDGGKDSIPPFVTTRGAMVLMSDTLAPDNPLTISGVYGGRGGDSATVMVGNVNQIDLSLNDSVVVITSLTPDLADPFNALRISVDSIRAGAPAGTYSHLIHNNAFKGVLDTVYCRVVLIGKNGKPSKVKDSSFTVGTPLPGNPITRLTATPRSSSQIRVSWEGAGTVDSIRVIYGTATVPPVQTPPLSYKRQSAVTPADTSMIISSLDATTTYYFGAQVFVGGQWSLVTPLSSASATTMGTDSSAPVINTIVIDGKSRFDTLSGCIVVRFHCDAAAGSDSLEWGYTWGLLDTLVINGRDTIGRNPRSLRTGPDSLVINPGEGILFDTDYQIRLWLHKAPNGRWAPPTAQSTDTVRTPSFTKQLVHYFTKDSTQVVRAFNGHVALWQTGKEWTIEELGDTLRVFRPQSMPNGFIPVSMGFRFTTKEGSPPFNIGIVYDSVPAGARVGDLRLYSWDEGEGRWVVFHESKADTVRHMVWMMITPNSTNVLNYPFIAMLDISRPSVGFSDTASVVPAGVAIAQGITVNDNVSNVKVTLLHGGGADTLKSQVKTLISAHLGQTIVDSIPAVSVNNEAGLRALVVVDDGGHCDTINISRRVRRTGLLIVPVNDQWVPVQVAATLDSAGASRIMNTFLDNGGTWEYDTKLFRWYRWLDTAENTATHDKWIEYGDARKELFDIRPGRLQWVKTHLSAKANKPVDYGIGTTTSLKDTFTMVLKRGAWTDFALPYKFSIRVGDIIDATNKNNTQVSSKLEMYRWGVKAGSKQYVANPLYISGLGPNDRMVPLTAEILDGYTVFNRDSSADITLRIPPTPSALSRINSPLGRSGAVAPEGGWLLTLHGRTSSGQEMSDVMCGYGEGSGGREYFAVPPGFGSAGMVVYDRGHGRSYGHALAHRAQNGGCSYEIRFFNRADTAVEITYSVNGTSGLPSGVSAAMVDPASKSVDMLRGGEFKVRVEGGSSGYRMLTVGSAGYHTAVMEQRGAWRFALMGAYPNPFKGMITIRYSIPYTGVNSVRMQLFDGLGRRVWQQEQGRVTPGVNMVRWDGKGREGKRHAAAGMYLLKLTGYDEKGRVAGTFREKLMYLP